MEIIKLNRKFILEEFNSFGIKKKSRIFLLPLIDANVSVHEFDPFLIDVNIDKDNIQLILIFDNTYISEEFKMIFYKLSNNYCYIDNSDYGGNGTELICNFSIPKEYRDDFFKFIDGKYSEMSEKYKKKILTFNMFPNVTHSVKGKITPYDILFPSEQKRKEIAEDLGVDIKNMNDDLYDKPNMDYEIYHPIEKLREIYKAFKEAKQDI